VTNTNVLPTVSAPSRRIATLDIVRGVAIVGTLGTNIWVFSHPWGLLGVLTNPVLAETEQAEGMAQLFLMALAQGKFLALLTLVFGVGLAIQHDSAVRRGTRWPGRYLWRAFLLFVDGAINYVLIAEFDVLMGYAVTGGIVAWLLLTRPRAQRAVILVAGGLHFLLISAIVALVAFDPTAINGEGPQGSSPYADASFFGLAAFRLENLVVFRTEPVLIGLLSLAMFLLGARLYRADVFGVDGGALRRQLMIAGACAVPIDLALGIFGGTAGLLAERYLVAPVVALGILGLIAELSLRRGSDGWFGRRIREIGRVALSAYILQNLLGGAVFYGWGFGLAEATASHRLLVTVVAFAVITSLVALFAHLWLRRFETGPVEWLWKLGANAPFRRG
jgi:uncharacterized protein